MPQMKQSMGVDQKIQLETLFFFSFFCPILLTHQWWQKRGKLVLALNALGMRHAGYNVKEDSQPEATVPVGCRFSVVRSWSKIMHSPSSWWSNDNLMGIYGDLWDLWSPVFFASQEFFAFVGQALIMALRTHVEGLLAATGVEISELSRRTVTGHGWRLRLKFKSGWHFRWFFSLVWNDWKNLDFWGLNHRSPDVVFETNLRFNLWCGARVADNLCVPTEKSSFLVGIGVD
jgi:hypothetical protein